MALGLCRIAVVAFVTLYAGAMFLFLTGTFGWFGQETDPLSAVFLIPLGLPWNMMLDGLPEHLLPWAAALAPVVNLTIIALICAWRDAARRN